MADPIHDLVFDRTRLVGTPTPLVFGETEVIADVPVVIAATLGGVTVAALAVLWVDAAMGATLGGVTVNAAVAYDNRVTPWLDNRAASDWNPGVEERSWVVHPWQLSAKKRDRTALPMSTAHAAERFVEAAHGLAFRQDNAHVAGYDTALGAQYESEAVHQKAIPITVERTNRYGLGELRARFTDHSNQAGIFNAHVRQLLWGVSRLSQLNFQNPIGKGVEHKAIEFSDHPWQLAGNARPGLSQWPPVVVVPPTPVSPWSSHLRFQCPSLLGMPIYLRFGGVTPCDPDVLPGDTVVVPIRRVYMLLNSATLKRVDGNIYLPTFNISLSLDVDSWTWGFSATLPGSTLPNLEPSVMGAPVEVEAMINGVPYRALIEGISRTREFGKSDIRIQGRGRAAILDAPYAAVQSFVNSEARTAQQLMADVLTENGVSLGWAVDWAMTDWLVPTGVFSHQGTHISALNAIAGAVGGYVQPHASTKTIRVANRYPTTPWTWGTLTPDYELPADVTTRESIDWAERARYNRVFVSGVGQGVLGQVTRAGTAGDLVAPLITDALITEAAAARQRGLSVLGNTGRIANVSLRLPVLAETGVITPGKFVRYLDGISPRTGIVRSVGVEVGLPEIWQTIVVETHVN